MLGGCPPLRDAPPPAAEGPVFWRPPSPIMPVGTNDTLHTRHLSHSRAGPRVAPPRIVVFYGVRLRTMRRRQRPSAACSSASAKSEAAVALQELMMLVAMSSTLETRSLDVASRIDDHSHAAPG